MRRTTLVAAHELRLLVTDPFPVVILVAMPLVVIAFLANGLVGGPGQAIPGLLVLFAFLGLYNVGLVFFREHGWRTWSRLRTQPVGTTELVVGKMLPLLALYVTQSVVLLWTGFLFFDMPMRGRLFDLAIVVAIVVAALSAIGLLLVSVCRTMNQVSAAANLGGLVLSGLGGALTPVSELPGWAEAIAPVSPVYWALEGLRGVIVHGETVTGLGGELAVLAGTTLVCALVAVLRFDAAHAKEFYA